LFVYLGVFYYVYSTHDQKCQSNSHGYFPGFDRKKVCEAKGVYLDIFYHVATGATIICVGLILGFILGMVAGVVTIFIIGGIQLGEWVYNFCSLIGKAAEGSMIMVFHDDLKKEAEEKRD
jgi:hypothetical protein